MSIILLALSGILFLNAYLEARKKFVLKKAPQRRKRANVATQSATLPTHATSTTGILLPAFTLWWRELVRFYRQRAA